MFANERRCSNFDEVIEEGKAMRATGTGITGGDPMLDFDKTVLAIRELKRYLGMITTSLLYLDSNQTRPSKELGKAGLDD